MVRLESEGGQTRPFSQSRPMQAQCNRTLQLVVVVWGELAPKSCLRGCCIRCDVRRREATAAAAEEKGGRGRASEGRRDNLRAGLDKAHYQYSHYLLPLSQVRLQHTRTEAHSYNKTDRHTHGCRRRPKGQARPASQRHTHRQTHTHTQTDTQTHTHKRSLLHGAGDPEEARQAIAAATAVEAAAAMPSEAGGSRRRIEFSVSLLLALSGLARRPIK